MKGNLRTIVAIVALLLLVGAATLVLPWLQQQNSSSESSGALIETNNDPITVSLGGYLLGDELVKVAPLQGLEGTEVNPLVWSLIILGILIVGIGGLAAVLYLVIVLLDRITTRTKEDPAFQAKVTQMEQRQKEVFKELEKTQPPTPIPDHNRPRWSAISTALVIVMFVAFAAIAVAQTLRPGMQVELLGTLMPVAVPIVLVAMLLAAVILVITVKPRRLAAVDTTDNEPVNWSALWVAVSGLVFLGIGLGLLFAVRTTVGG
ncbi:MAG: hypothetical protein H6666_13515 [Ardenticatenaceae bacterium]|nr:hypothetical protein [Anaerolineales bacterium]MCB8918929.1 hypothetical protein [Ardenticatenaceae bacterium]